MHAIIGVVRGGTVLLGVHFAGDPTTSTPERQRMVDDDAALTTDLWGVFPGEPRVLDADAAEPADRIVDVGVEQRRRRIRRLGSSRGVLRGRGRCRRAAVAVG
jgi:hypothetical protein